MKDLNEGYVSELSDEIKDQDLSIALTRKEEELKLKEKRLMEMGKSLEKKEAQMGYMMHEINNLVSQVLRLYEMQCQLFERNEKHESINQTLRYCSSRLRFIMEAYRILFNPNMLETSHLYLQDIHEIVLKICSYYSETKGICVTQIGETAKEFMLNHEIGLAVCLILDNALFESPENSEIQICFSENNDNMTVEFKSWERCREGNGVFCLSQKSLNSRIVWNVGDEDVVMNLFNRICCSNDVAYKINRGEVKKAFGDELYQSFVVILTFNSELK